MKNWIQYACIVAVWLASLGVAQAGDPIGYVKNVQGIASVITAGVNDGAKVGTAVFQGSQIRTGVGASLGITFKDNTLMSFGPDTDLTIDEYLYNPNIGQLKFGSKLTKGTLNYVSGTIAKLNPKGVTVRTPAGNIGVRGTHFVVKVEDAK
jgi:hypothetical protein